MAEVHILGGEELLSK